MPEIIKRRKSGKLTAPCKGVSVIKKIGVALTHTNSMCDASAHIITFASIYFWFPVFSFPLTNIPKDQATALMGFTALNGLEANEP